MTITSTANETCISGYRLSHCAGGIRLASRGWHTALAGTCGHHRKAVELGQRLQGGALIKLVHVTEDLFEAGWSRFQSRPDKRYSLTDCISFIVMERRELDIALAFDQHFEQAGFQVAPGGRSW